MIQQNISFTDEAVRVSLQHSAVSVSQTYRYEVHLGGSVIFEGNKYIAQGATTTVIDVTETLASVRWTPSWDAMAVTASTITTYTQVRGLIDRVTVRLYGTDANPATYVAGYANYAGVYRYPNRKDSMEWTFPLPTMTGSTASVWNMLQGYSARLTPHFPSMPSSSSNGLYTPVTIAVYTPNTGDHLFRRMKSGATGSTGYVTDLGVIPQGFSVGYAQTRLFQNTGRDIVSFGIGASSSTATYTDMAICDDTDKCRYYLLWQDRYGGFQSQPFQGTDTFKESLSSSEIKQYDGTRRRTGADIKPSWSLNTGWLRAEQYPFYESLLCSPMVVLTDTEQRMQYNVMVTDSDYTEKTFTNQGRRMFNLSVNVDLARGQQMKF